MSIDARWSTVVVEVPTADVDVVSGLLWGAGVTGVEEVALAGGVQLRAGCDSSVVDGVLAAIGDRWTVRVESVEADAGLDAWRSHAEVWRAGDRFVIVPPWLDAPTELPSDAIVLPVDPGHAFGSGSHTTTRDCLAILERVVAPGEVMVDVGTGSGVLAIAAILLGAREAIATDIDDRALAATTENAARCGVADRVMVDARTPAELGTAIAEVVVANIGAATLRALAADLVALVRPGGALVLSGLLDVQVDEVVAVFVSLGMVDDTTIVSGEWRTVLLRAPR